MGLWHLRVVVTTTQHASYIPKQRLCPSPPSQSPSSTHKPCRARGPSQAATRPHPRTHDRLKARNESPPPEPRLPIPGRDGSCCRPSDTTRTARRRLRSSGARHAESLPSAHCVSFPPAMLGAFSPAMGQRAACAGRPGLAHSGAAGTGPRRGPASRRPSPSSATQMDALPRARGVWRLL